MGHKVAFIQGLRDPEQALLEDSGNVRATESPFFGIAGNTRNSSAGST
jgi:hypothetical protein